MDDEKKFETVIVPKTGWFDVNLKEVWKYRDLIMLFVKRDFVSLYKQTLLGPAWAIIQPLLTTVVFTLIFGNLAGLGPADGTPQFLFYLSGTVLWSYFSSCLTTTAGTFIGNSGILGKVYFPRLVMPVSTVISKMISLAIQFVFMLFFLVYYLITGSGVQPNWFILMTPLLVLELAALGLGFGVIVSSLTTKYRDLNMLISFGVSLWMYATPVAYSLDKFANHPWIQTIMQINPVTPIIDVFRYAYFGTGEVHWNFYWLSWLITLVVLFLGITLFSRVEKTFMDTV